MNIIKDLIMLINKIVFIWVASSRNVFKTCYGQKKQEKKGNFLRGQQNQPAIQLTHSPLL